MSLSCESAIAGVVDGIHSSLGVKCVHTFQFISVGDVAGNLRWHTYGIDLRRYTSAVLRFIQLDPVSSQAHRTLVRSDFQGGPYAYEDLGAEWHPPGGFNYAYAEHADTSIHDSVGWPDAAASDRLIREWWGTLRDEFGSAGSAMWISQPYEHPGRLPITSSVFLLATRPISVDKRYCVAKLCRDFLITQIIRVWGEGLERKVAESRTSFEAQLKSILNKVYITSDVRECLTKSQAMIRSNFPVLITGESGTGKTTIARAVHALSQRTGPRVEIDSSEAGSTVETFEGHVSAASGGTLVVSDIDSASLGTQVAIRRYLDNSSIDAGLVFTSMPHLDEAVASGQFDRELLVRLNYVHVPLQPLRYRVQELEEICNEILSGISVLGSIPKRVDESAVEKLSKHKFLANYRELTNLLVQASFRADGDGKVIKAEHIVIP